MERSSSLLSRPSAVGHNHCKWLRLKMPAICSASPCRNPLNCCPSMTRAAGYLDMLARSSTAQRPSLNTPSPLSKSKTQQLAQEARRATGTQYKQTAGVAPSQPHGAAWLNVMTPFPLVHIAISSGGDRKAPVMLEVATCAWRST